MFPRLIWNNCLNTYFWFKLVVTPCVYTVNSLNQAKLRIFSIYAYTYFHCSNTLKMYCLKTFEFYNTSLLTIINVWLHKSLDLFLLLASVFTQGKEYVYREIPRLHTVVAWSALWSSLRFVRVAGYGRDTDCWNATKWGIQRQERLEQEGKLAPNPPLLLVVSGLGPSRAVVPLRGHSPEAE